MPWGGKGGCVGGGSLEEGGIDGIERNRSSEERVRYIQYMNNMKE